MKKKYDVFISYSRKDSFDVDKICQTLRMHQITYFKDTKEIYGGAEFFDELAAAIKSSDVFLYIGSINSYESKFTPKEVGFAINEKKAINIIPYIIDENPLPDNLKFAFADINIRYKKQHDIDVIICDIKEKIPRLKKLYINSACNEVDNIKYCPHYLEGLANYQFAEMCFYGDYEGPSIERQISMAANARFAEIRGFSNRAKWLYNNIISQDDDFKYRLQRFLSNNPISQEIQSELIIDEDRRQDIIKKIKGGIPIHSISFIDEIDEDCILKSDNISPKNQKLSIKSVSFDNYDIHLVRVEGGNYKMGASFREGGDAEDEQIIHQVTLSDFYISIVPVTQLLWRLVMGNNPSNLKSDKHPVESVSWNDCLNFIQKLNQRTNLKFRLPTEAEWEYAAKGGLLGRHNSYKYSGSNNPYNVSWNKENSNNYIHDVATKCSNELGLYDMNGNVWEWCDDWYGPYEKDSQINPKGPDIGEKKIIRGGSFMSVAKDTRNTIRESEYPYEKSVDIGFRLVL